MPRFIESKAENHLFHNKIVKVCPVRVKFEEIEYWKDNNRTLLAFEAYEKKSKSFSKKLTAQQQKDQELQGLTNYLASRKDMALSTLAESIRQSGVKVPLILVSQGNSYGQLLDGNRRYFACAYLKFKALEEGEPRPTVLDRIPALLIKKSDLTENLRLKILAEVNFVKDLKVPWSIDVKARLIRNFYDGLKKKGVAPDQIYKQILDVFDVDKSTVESYLDSLILVQDFIRKATKKEKLVCREIAQEHFVYFWEFRNKATKGRFKLTESELKKVKPLFFKMMRLERFRNFKQIEIFIQAVHDEELWDELEKSDGSKLQHVIGILESEKNQRTQESKARQFARWLQTESELKMTRVTLQWLREIIKEAEAILEDQWEDPT